MNRLIGPIAAGGGGLLALLLVGFLIHRHLWLRKARRACHRRLVDVPNDPRVATVAAPHHHLNEQDRLALIAFADGLQVREEGRPRIITSVQLLETECRSIDFN